MRLSVPQIQVIKNAVDQVLAAQNQVWLFGSRVNDNARGGDIDLFVETDAILGNRAEAICRIYGALFMALGDRKIDILLKDAQTSEAPIFSIARDTGVKL